MFYDIAVQYSYQGNRRHDGREGTAGRTDLIYPVPMKPRAVATANGCVLPDVMFVSRKVTGRCRPEIWRRKILMLLSCRKRSRWRSVIDWSDAKMTVTE